MPSSKKIEEKMKETEELERWLDEIEKELDKSAMQADSTNSETSVNMREPPDTLPAQTRTVAQTQPSYAPSPAPPRQLTDREKDALALVAKRLSERTGKPIEQIYMALEELFSEDNKLLDIIRRFGEIKSTLAEGEISRRYADMASAKLLSRLSRRLTDRFDRSSSFDFDNILELYKMKLLEKLLFELEDDKKNNQPVYRVPLIDPNTGEVVRDANGNPVFIETTQPILPQMLVPQRSSREEELKREIERLHEELRKIREEEERKKEIAKLEEKLASLEAKLIELKNLGGGGEGKGGPSSLSDIVKLIEESKKALEELGYRIERGEKREDPVFELQKKNLEIKQEFYRQIAPALAELLKDPRRIADAVRSLAYLLNGMRKPNVMEQVRSQTVTAVAEKPVEEIPRLEEYLGE